MIDCPTLGIDRFDEHSLANPFTSHDGALTTPSLLLYTDPPLDERTRGPMNKVAALPADEADNG